MIHRLPFSTAGLVIAAAAASPAYAGWTLASADAPVSVIRGTRLSDLNAGASLHEADILESREGVVHLQDEHGTLLALGARTRVMLAADAHVALLDGWLKVAAAPCALHACATPHVDTERGALDIGVGAAAIVLARDDANAVDIFSETGTQTLPAKPPVTLASGRFVTLDAHAGAQQAARPSSAFLADMPVAFRDALQPLAPAKPSQSAPVSRAVAYGDISPWLVSSLPERRTFPARFRSRLADTAFRRDVDANLKALPDWRALLHPPRRLDAAGTRHP